MKYPPVLAIVGATGLIGGEIVQIIDQLKVPYSELKLLASQDSVGELYKVGEDEAAIQKLQSDSFIGVDIAFFATTQELAQEFIPHAVKHGAVVIDNSNYSAMQPELPLVIPEVNPRLLTSKPQIIANPCSSIVLLAPVLDSINRVAGLKRVVVSTYQSVSGAGKAALDELWSQSLAIFNQKEIVNEEFQHQIAFNCIPQIDLFLEDAYTKEEHKIIDQARKILTLPDLAITATAVRVPVFHGHAASVSVETERPLRPDDLVTLLTKSSGIEVFSDPTEYPMHLNVAFSDSIQVGRIRQDYSVKHGLNLWIVADNVRKGAALNAVQIAQLLIEQRA